MLSVIGQAPTNSLTEGVTTDVTLAIQVLDEETRHVQSEGWLWNTDREFKVQQQTGEDRFEWGSDWAKFDVDERDYDLDIVRRGGYLYNRAKSTYDLGQTTLTGTVVRYLDWDDMPQPARAYITARAARIYLSRTIPDSERLVHAREAEESARNELVAHETDQGGAAWPETLTRFNGRPPLRLPK